MGTPLLCVFRSLISLAVCCSMGLRISSRHLSSGPDVVASCCVFLLGYKSFSSATYRRMWFRDGLLCGPCSLSSHLHPKLTTVASRVVTSVFAQRLCENFDA